MKTRREVIRVLAEQYKMANTRNNSSEILDSALKKEKTHCISGGDARHTMRLGSVGLSLC